jgi:hypothetical protein
MYVSGYYNKVNFRRFYENVSGQAKDKKGHKITITEEIERDASGKIATRREIYTDYNGNATRKITRENGRLVLDELFGVYEKHYEKGKCVREINFVAGSLSSKNGLQTDRTETLFGEKIKCLSWYSRGSLYKQVATYSNNRVAYRYSKGSKKPVLLYRKSGELWAEYAGAPVAWSPRGCIFNAGGRWRWEQDNEKDRKKTPADVSGSGDFSLKVYDKRGKVVHSGQYESSQKVGEWLEKGATTYYLSGVQVSETLFKSDPDKWDADEILSIENAQLRASLLKKFTYERLLQRKQGRVVDTDTTDGRDNSIRCEYRLI